jgi:hypothetical protein
MVKVLAAIIAVTNPNHANAEAMPDFSVVYQISMPENSKYKNY